MRFKRQMTPNEQAALRTLPIYTTLSCYRLLPVVFVAACWLAAGGSAAERDAEAAKEAALGHSPDLERRERPAHLPDVTKGEVIPPAKKVGVRAWNLGPTGIVGTPNAWYAGDQVQVLAVLPGSPAEGKVLPGDVILGVQGQDFVAGGHLGITIGNAIVKAEEEAGQGRLSLHLWRDRNLNKRGAPKDVLGIDIDELMQQAEETQLYEWEEDAERKTSVKQQAYDEFPVDAIHTNVSLQLEVMGTYSATSPWKCPVSDKIREDALQVIAAGFRPDKRGRSRGDWPGVLALVASGKPEYAALAKQWVHRQKVTRDMNLETTLDDMDYRGMQSWAAGFEALEQAIYYDATGDEFILPEIRKRAIWTAMGQNGGGSWGHTFAFPEFNGGELHKRNPGYGAMNNAGTRCFFLLTLARKFGIEHPEIDPAIDRAARFFGTFVDKGCVPYGYHPPYGSDDSNGKNYGATYAFHVLGKTHAAKYFSMTSANAAFSRRGGHGSPTLWYYTPLSANLSGPRGVTAAMGNMRWFYTLARRHDGSFVFQGKQAGIGGKGMRNPTATHALYYAVPLKQLIITGKGVDRSVWMNDEELEELLLSARGQIREPSLLDMIGEPWNQRDTDELIALLDHFFPNMRRSIAGELAARFNAGEQTIIAKLLPLLTGQDARARDGACLALKACGRDTVLEHLSKLTPLLDDPAEFVRMTAIGTIAAATDPASPDRQMMLLKAAVDDYEGMSMDNGNARSVVKQKLFQKTQETESPVSSFYTEPFTLGFDYNLLRSALENIVTMDPGGTIPQTWTQDTLVRLAGPVVYAATVEQINDGMFGLGRLMAAKALIAKYGYREQNERDFAFLRQRGLLNRDLRPRVEFMHGRQLKGLGYIDIGLLRKHPSLYREQLDAMCLWLQDQPLRTDAPEGIWIGELIRMVQNAGDESPAMPSLRRESFDLFTRELEALEGAGARIKRCRAVLADPERKDYFRKLAAMAHLQELLAADAVADIAPYLGHAYWRLRDEAHRIAVELVQAGGPDPLTALLASADGENAAGMLLALGDAGDKRALTAVNAALKRPAAVVRKAAVQALMTLGGDKALPMVLAFMDKTTDPDDLWGCELALLSRREDAVFSRRVRDEMIARLPKSTMPVRRSLAWVLAQLGGPESLAALQAAAEKSDDPQDVRNIVKALSYSPDRGADTVMLTLGKLGRIQLDAVAAESIRRMVGPNGPDDVSDRQRVDFARGILDMKLDNRLIQFLGNVPTGRSIQLLFEVMKESNLTALAAKSIISAAEGMSDPPPDEAKIAADALSQVIEYIEVTRLRGGMAAHMRKEDNYLGWKNIQARAGKALLKVHQPEKAPIPTFDDMDLDL